MADRPDLVYWFEPCLPSRSDVRDVEKPRSALERWTVGRIICYWSWDEGDAGGLGRCRHEERGGEVGEGRSEGMEVEGK